MYEYSTTTITYQAGPDITWINENAKKGWRLIQLISFDNGALAGITKYYWERKIPDPIPEDSRMKWCGRCGISHHPGEHIDNLGH